MEFARELMLKHGWKEGKGLGRNEDGMTQALKPKLKFDVSGVGYDLGEQFTNHWWQNVYNNAANNIKICKKKGGISVETEGESVDITTSKCISSKRMKNKKLTYGNFLQTATLTDGGEVRNIPDEDEPVETASSQSLPDEELFRICGGRTVHKAARHGMKLNGKLARVEAQEQELLERLRLKTTDRLRDEEPSVCDVVEDAPVVPQKKKKRKKNVVDDVESSLCSDTGVIDDLEIHVNDMSRCKSDRNRHKKRKSSKQDEHNVSVVIEETGKTRETEKVECSGTVDTESASRRHKKKRSKKDCS